MTQIGENFLGLIAAEGNEGADANNGENNSGKIGDGDADAGKVGDTETGKASGEGTPPVDAATGNEGGDAGKATDAGTANSNEEEYDVNKILGFFEKNGKKVDSIDDLLKEPEPKIVNQYEKISPKAKAFLDFHNETGRDYEDYQELQKDISKISDLDFARERVRNENTGNWSDEQIDSYLEKRLKIDLTDPSDLDVSDQIELSGFAKAVREQKIADQEKYKQPLEVNPPAAKQPIGEDMVELQSGEVIQKVVYEKMLSDRDDYLEGVKDSTDKITGSTFGIKVDDNGTEKVLTYSYDFSKEDKQEMLTSAEDLSKTVKALFQTEEGFKHSDLVEGMFWLNPKNREKAISALVNKALAERTEELMKQEGNIRLGNNGDLPTSKDGRKTIPLQQNDGFGVKGNF